MINKAILVLATFGTITQGLVTSANAFFDLQLFPVYSFCTSSEHNHSRKWINAVLFGVPFLTALIGTFYYDIKSLKLVRRKRENIAAKNRPAKQLLQGLCYFSLH